MTTETLSSRLQLRWSCVSVSLAAAIGACAFPSLVHSEELLPQSAKLGSVRRTPLGLFLGYTAHEMSSPGLHLGAEFPLAETAHFSSLALAAFQAYAQPNTEAGYALHLRWGQRFTASFGLTIESHIGIGVQLTRYDTTTFEFAGSIATPRERTTSRLAFSPQILLGPGFDFERVTRIPVHVYARPGIMLIYPDLNLAFQASFIAELGLRWSI